MKTAKKKHEFLGMSVVTLPWKVLDEYIQRYILYYLPIYVSSWEPLPASITRFSERIHGGFLKTFEFQ